MYKIHILKVKKKLLTPMCIIFICGTQKKMDED